MTQGPLVAVVVLNFRGAGHTIACVESVLASRGANLQVIIVDNASGDDSVPRLRARFATDERVQLLTSPRNGGYTAGNNLGVERARARGARFAFVLNNDTVVDASCIERLVAEAECDERVALVNPRIFFSEPWNALWFDGGRYSPWTGRPGHVGWRSAPRDLSMASRELPFATGCAMLIRLSALPEAPFDESLFGYAEDLDLSLRARARGDRVRYVPSAVLWHHDGAAHRGVGGDALRMYLSVRNLLRVNARHARWYHWPSLAPCLAVDLVLRYAVVALRDRDPRAFVAVLRGVVHAVSGGRHAIEPRPARVAPPTGTALRIDS